MFYARFMYYNNTEGIWSILSMKKQTNKKTKKQKQNKNKTKTKKQFEKFRC